VNEHTLAAARPTVITFPSGSCGERATVLQTLPDPRGEEGRRLIVITELTPFHTLDPLWPDQPADHGELAVGGRTFPVFDSVTVAQRSGGPIMVDSAIDARRDEPDVLFVVGHVVDAAAKSLLADGADVTLTVDAARRLRLSAAHTACHLLAYALNEATHELWSRPTQTDSRGHNDLDAASCVVTRHDEGGSHDEYRFGKSLRRSGFDSARFLADLPNYLAQVNATLATWIDSAAEVRIECDGPLLTDRRRWYCETPDGTASMPCGGTHVRRLDEIRSMVAAAEFDADAGILTIRNAVDVAG
jgi:alanyl-tRNA synthetase